MSTRENIRLIARSPMWFVGAIFVVCCSVICSLLLRYLWFVAA